jgi:DNA primase
MRQTLIMDDMKEKYENFKEQVRQAADIVGVVSETVDLRKKGSRLWGCCPFHSEKTPSFTVDPEKGFFHCFGCGAGGDVFTFVMKRDHVAFPEALKILANKYGIPIPERAKTAEEIQREKETKAVLDANELAARFFHACLTKTRYGKTGIAYLAGRGIGKEIIESFQLGMAPPDFSTLHTALEKRGVAEEVLLKAGLVSRSSRQPGVYDKFRERIMIPIKNPRGRVVGFTGRILRKEASPAKYMNTGETAWFHKGRLLFGLDRAMTSIRRRQQALVVEGHMDAISLHAAGITYTVASMGTAFTEQQARLLKRLTPEVIFCFDSDQAGRNAAMRAIPLALKEGLRCKVMHVTDGKDPDEFVRKEGRQAFEDLIQKAKGGIDYEVDTVLERSDTETLSGKVGAVAEILPFFRDCHSDVEVGERIRDLARRLALDENEVRSEYRKLTGQGRHGSSYNPEWLLQRQVKPGTSTEQAERGVLLALLNGLVPDASQAGFANIDSFTVPSRQAIYRAYLTRVQNGTLGDPRNLFEDLDPDSAAELTKILELNVPFETLPVVLRDCLNRLQSAALEREYEKHSRLAEEYEKEGNEKFLEELEECRRIRTEIRNLTTVPISGS